LRKTSRTQKLQIAAIAIAASLIFYAVGIATNLFANRIFSMFFIISNQTAHDIITYLAIGIAAALAITAITLSLSKKRKPRLFETSSKLSTRTFKSSGEHPIVVTSSVDNQKILTKPENIKVKRNEPAKKLIMEPTKQSTTQIHAEIDTDKNVKISQEKEEKNIARLTCPNCKKEFSTPLFSLDYSSSKPTLVRLCPYCNKTIDSAPKNTSDEDLWKKYSAT
jgi:hypothetical protein